MAENKVASHRVVPAVWERIDAASAGTTVFWVGPEAIVVRLDGEACLDRWAPTHPYRNTYLAPISVTLVRSEARSGIPGSHVTVDISNAIGKWVKRRVLAANVQAIDDLRQ